MIHKVPVSVRVHHSTLLNDNIRPIPIPHTSVSYPPTNIQWSLRVIIEYVPEEKQWSGERESVSQLVNESVNESVSQSVSQSVRSHHIAINT